MDFSRLSTEEIQTFLNRHAPRMSPERVKYAFDTLIKNGTTIQPSAIVDLYIASRYSGPRDQSYLPDDILNLTQEDIRAFEKVFDYFFEGSIQEKRRHILRILSYLGLIDYDHNILLQPTILDEFCPLLSADDLIKFRQATYLTELICPVTVNDKSKQVTTVSRIDTSSIPIIERVEKIGSALYLVNSSASGNIGTVRYLLDNRADPNLFHREISPLIAASGADNNVEVVRTLLEHKANPNLSGRYGLTALILAADKGNLDTVKELLNARANTEASITDEYGGTPLIKASHRGYLDIVKELLAAKADVNGVTEQYQETALILATSGGHVDIMKELIAAGADLEHRNMDDYTPLMVASFEGRTNSAQVLIEAKAMVNAQEDISGYTPLMLATDKNHPQVVELLLEAGADPNINTGDEEEPGITALEIAHQEHNQELIDILSPVTIFDPELEERVRVLDEMKEQMEEFEEVERERWREEMEEIERMRDEEFDNYGYYLDESEEEED